MAKRKVSSYKKSDGTVVPAHTRKSTAKKPVQAPSKETIRKFTIPVTDTDAHDEHPINAALRRKENLDQIGVDAEVDFDKSTGTWTIRN